VVFSLQAFWLKLSSAPCSQSKIHAHFPLLRLFQRICPSLRPHITYHDMLFVYDEKLLGPAEPPCQRTTPCFLSMTTYSIYLQHSSMSGGGCLLHPMTFTRECSKVSRPAAWRENQKGPALCHYVQFYRYFVTQSSEFCCHNPLKRTATSNTKGKSIFRYWLSQETFGYTLVCP
jgi:hypothetical protein